MVVRTYNNKKPGFTGRIIMTRTVCMVLFAMLITMLTVCGGSRSSATPAQVTSPTDDALPSDTSDSGGADDTSPPISSVVGEGDIQVFSNRADLISGRNELFLVEAADVEKLSGDKNTL